MPEKPETEPQGHATVHDYSSAEELEREGLPEGEEAELDADALRAEIADLKDKLLRAIAEVENVRKRGEKENAEARKFGISSFARDLMTVTDNFHRALETITDEMRETGGEFVTNLIAGIEMTERELMSAFEKNGIRRVNPPPGGKFDPNFHQAIAEVPDTGRPNGSIVEVTQNGYALDNRLLRPAMVLVARSQQEAGGDTPETDKAENDKPADPGSKINTTV